MAEVIPINFPIPSESAIASYSYTDIAEGTGRVDFYGTYMANTGSGVYRMITEVLHPDTRNTDHPIDIDFDTVLNAPKRIKGDIYVSFSIVISNTVGLGTAYFTAYLRKWDGSTETDIANGVSAVASVTAAAAAKTFCFRIPVDTIAHFAKGETLRISLVESYTSAGGVFSLRLWHDPTDTASGYLGATPDTTRMIFSVPFVLDL